MKTDDLIRAMVADNASVKAPISRTVWLALGAGLLLAVAHFFSLLGVRSDFAHAIMNDPRFMFKFVFTIGLAIPAALLVLRLARPDGVAGWSKWLLIVPPLLLAGAVMLEMQAVPSDHWAVSAFGSMPVACMKYIPVLSLAPFVAILFALRQGAPSRPAAAGAAAGLLSGAIGAALYATFCVDDSPMFLAIWYVAGITIVSALGAVVGSRLLKW